MDYLERLTEAVNDVDEGYGVYDEVTPTIEILLEAARAYRELLANGERVEWCEEHKCGVELDDGMCSFHLLELAVYPHSPSTVCRVVSKLLVDYPTEEPSDV